jgi:predicted small lipoprotein YifL
MKKLVTLVLLLSVFTLAGCGSKLKLSAVPGEINELYSAEPSAKPIENIKLKIKTPLSGQLIKEKSVTVSFEVNNFVLGTKTKGHGKNGLAASEKGQHIHLIVGNEPYQAIYDTKEPVIITGLKPGRHSIRAFLSRSWHESVKEAGSYQELDLYFQKVTTETIPTAGVLTYSRPKGDYEGKDAKLILVDFFLDKVELSPEGFKVKLVVDGKASYLTTWKAYYLKDLAPGEHKIQLALLDSKNKRVPGEFNNTYRTIVVK